MTVREMLTLLITSALFLTGLGGGVGFLLGKFLPVHTTARYFVTAKMKALILWQRALVKVSRKASLPVQSSAFY